MNLPILMAEFITEAFDQGTHFAMHHIVDPPVGQWTVPILRGFSALGNPWILLGLTLLVGFLFLRNNNFRRSALLIAFLGIAIGLGFLARGVVQRPYPHAGYSPILDAPEYSFPSVHALGAAFFYLSLAFFLRADAEEKSRRWLLWLASLLILLIGFSQMALGVSYPTDVFAGWVVGIALSFFCVSLDNTQKVTT